MTWRAVCDGPYRVGVGGVGSRGGGLVHLGRKSVVDDGSRGGCLPIHLAGTAPGCLRVSIAAHVTATTETSPRSASRPPSPGFNLQSKQHGDGNGSVQYRKMLRVNARISECSSLREVLRAGRCRLTV